MFDLNRLTEAVTGLLAGTGGDRQAVGQEAADVLTSLGIDPSVIGGASQDELMRLLAEHGVDPSALGPEQIAALVESAGLPPQVVDMAQLWLDRNHN